MSLGRTAEEYNKDKRRLENEIQALEVSERTHKQKAESQQAELSQLQRDEDTLQGKIKRLTEKEGNPEIRRNKEELQGVVKDLNEKKKELEIIKNKIIKVKEQSRTTNKSLVEIRTKKDDLKEELSTVNTFLLLAEARERKAKREEDAERGQEREALRTEEHRAQLKSEQRKREIDEFTKLEREAAREGKEQAREKASQKEAKERAERIQKEEKDRKEAAKKQESRLASARADGLAEARTEARQRKQAADELDALSKERRDKTRAEEKQDAILSQADRVLAQMEKKQEKHSNKKVEKEAEELATRQEEEKEAKKAQIQADLPRKVGVRLNKMGDALEEGKYITFLRIVFQSDEADTWFAPRLCLDSKGEYVNIDIQQSAKNVFMRIKSDLGIAEDDKLTDELFQQNLHKLSGAIIANNKNFFDDLRIWFNSIEYKNSNDKSSLQQNLNVYEVQSSFMCSRHHDKHTLKEAKKIKEAAKDAVVSTAEEISKDNDFLIKYATQFKNIKAMFSKDQNEAKSEIKDKTERLHKRSVKIIDDLIKLYEKSHLTKEDVLTHYASPTTFVYSQINYNEKEINALKEQYATFIKFLKKCPPNPDDDKYQRISLAISLQAQGRLKNENSLIDLLKEAGITDQSDIAKLKSVTANEFIIAESLYKIGKINNTSTNEEVGEEFSRAVYRENVFRNAMNLPCSELQAAIDELASIHLQKTAGLEKFVSPSEWHQYLFSQPKEESAQEKEMRKSNRDDFVRSNLDFTLKPQIDLFSQDQAKAARAVKYITQYVGMILPERIIHLPTPTLKLFGGTTSFARVDFGDEDEKVTLSSKPKAGVVSKLGLTGTQGGSASKVPSTDEAVKRKPNPLRRNSDE